MAEIKFEIIKKIETLSISVCAGLLTARRSEAEIPAFYPGRFLTVRSSNCLIQWHPLSGFHEQG